MLWTTRTMSGRLLAKRWPSITTGMSRSTCQRAARADMQLPTTSCNVTQTARGCAVSLQTWPTGTSRTWKTKMGTSLVFSWCELRLPLVSSGSMLQTAEGV